MSLPQFSSPTNARIGKGLLALAVCLGLLSAWRWYVEAQFLRAASVTQGLVVSTTKKMDSAEVAYQDNNGVSHKLTPWVKASSRRYAVGEKVEVLYLPDDPVVAKFNEPMQIWATTHLLLLVSAIAGSIGLLTYKKIITWGPLVQKRLKVGL